MPSHRVFDARFRQILVPSINVPSTSNAAISDASGNMSCRTNKSDDNEGDAFSCCAFFAFFIASFGGQCRSDNKPYGKRARINRGCLIFIAPAFDDERDDEYARRNHATVAPPSSAHTCCVRGRSVGGACEKRLQARLSSAQTPFRIRTCAGRSTRSGWPAIAINSTVEAYAMKANESTIRRAYCCSYYFGNAISMYTARPNVFSTFFPFSS